MRHSDFSCCMVCDMELYYAPWESQKAVLCAGCVYDLHREGIDVRTASDLWKWVQWMIHEGKSEDVLRLLNKLGYWVCKHDNPFDSLVDAANEAAELAYVES